MNPAVQNTNGFVKEWWKARYDDFFSKIVVFYSSAIIIETALGALLPYKNQDDYVSGLETFVGMFLLHLIWFGLSLLVHNASRYLDIKLNLNAGSKRSLVWFNASRFFAYLPVLMLVWAVVGFIISIISYYR